MLPREADGVRPEEGQGASKRGRVGVGCCSRHEETVEFTVYSNLNYFYDAVMNRRSTFILRQVETVDGGYGVSGFSRLA